MDIIVFTQDELNAAVKNGCKTICLCDNHYEIDQIPDITYSAIGNVTAVTELTKDDCEKLGIKFFNLTPGYLKQQPMNFGNKPQYANVPMYTLRYGCLQGGSYTTSGGSYMTSGGSFSTSYKLTNSYRLNTSYQLSGSFNTSYRLNTSYQFVTSYGFNTSYMFNTSYSFANSYLFGTSYRYLTSYRTSFGSSYMNEWEYHFRTSFASSFETSYRLMTSYRYAGSFKAVGSFKTSFAKSTSFKKHIKSAMQVNNDTYNGGYIAVNGYGINLI